MTFNELRSALGGLMFGSLQATLDEHKVIVHIKASDTNIEEFFDIENVEIANDGTGNIHILVVEQADSVKKEVV